MALSKRFKEASGRVDRARLYALGEAVALLKELPGAKFDESVDLAVRLGYAGVEHTLVHDTIAAIRSCPPGHVEVVANYTAFLNVQRTLERNG